MFFLLELIKKYLKQVILSTICIVGIFIIILSIDGALFMPLLSLTEQAPEFSFWMQIIGKIILGVGYGIMLGVFLLVYQKSVKIYLSSKFKILQLIIPPKRQELLTQLKQTQEELRTLQKLLPICASCKKIRNDDGYWQQVEHYFADHSEYTFSHGLCPECMKKLYPEFTP